MNDGAVLVKVYRMRGNSAKLHDSTWHDRADGEIKVGPYPWPWMLEITTATGTDQVFVEAGKVMTWVPMGPEEKLWGMR
jgi:hypothetical protein